MWSPVRVEMREVPSEQGICGLSRHTNPKRKGTSQVRLLHAPARTTATFDDRNLVSCTGLAALSRLTDDLGLHDLVTDRLRVTGDEGANPAAKIGSLLAGMVAGADSIEDMNLLRHGGMPVAFTGIRAPSTLGSFLRAFTHGNVRQLTAVHRELLARATGHTDLLSGADQLVIIDVDSLQRRVFGYKKQGAAFGHAKIASKDLMVRGLNGLVATVSTPIAAPVAVAARLHGGSAASSRGAHVLLAEAVNTVRAATTPALVVARGDSAYYTGEFITTARRHDVEFSVTVKMDVKVKRAIAGIDETAWTAIKYPNAIYEQETREWISDAEVAETTYTAFESKKRHRVTARLIVRRVRRLQPADGKEELLPAYRYHAIFTNVTFPLVEAEAFHRRHAVVEQFFADLIDGPLAHLPSGKFNANAAWLQLACTAHLLGRTLGVMASPRHALARPATLRRELNNVPARLAQSGRGNLTWHLPVGCRRESPWHNIFHNAGPPAAARAA
jgi:hypothetical protein